MNETTTITKKTAQELYSIADRYVNTGFNFIQLEVVNKMCDNMLFEHIDQAEIDFEAFVSDYDLEDKLLHHLQESFDDITKGLDLFKEEVFEEEIKYFCENHESFDSYRERKEEDNYPMWNTCFEFRNEPSEDEIQAGINAGFGVIRGVDGFNTLLFASSCGHSFYSAYWIPMIIDFGYMVTKEEVEGVRFDMM